MNHAINIGDFYHIAGAILNKYRELIAMKGATAEVACFNCLDYFSYFASVD